MSKSYYLETAKELIKKLDCVTDKFPRERDAVFGDNEPVQQVVIPDPPHTRTFSTISGADCVVVVDGTLAGHVQSVTFSQASPGAARNIATFSDYYDRLHVTEFPATIVVDAIAFAQTDDNTFDSSSEHQIIMNYKTEYGDECHQIIERCCLIQADGGIAIDSIFPYRRYILCAADVTPMQPGNIAISIPVIEE